MRSSVYSRVAPWRAAAAIARLSPSPLRWLTAPWSGGWQFLPTAGGMGPLQVGLRDGYSGAAVVVKSER
jgi:hypothetical protein